MMRGREPRPAAPPSGGTALDRALAVLGADRAFAESVLGDLAEEYRERAACGAASARRWYLTELLRAVPQLVWSATRHAAGRARLAAVLAGAALVSVAFCFVRLVSAGPPVRLTAGTRDTVVVNAIGPVRVPLRVLDAAGRTLSDTGVRFAHRAGAPITVSPRGVVRCTRAGDAVVRASLGPLATNVQVRCRPVHQVLAESQTDFVLGDPAREVALMAVGVDGRPVSLLGVRLQIEDSTVATLDGLRVRPLAAGATQLGIRIGNRTAGSTIRVFEPVSTLDGLRPEQSLVAAAVRLSPGDSIRWPLPLGRFYVSFLPRARGGPTPMLAVDGAVMCIPALAPGVQDTRCLVRRPGAWVTVSAPPDARPPHARPDLLGALALHRDRDP